MAATTLVILNFRGKQFYFYRVCCVRFCKNEWMCCQANKMIWFPGFCPAYFLCGRFKTAAIRVGDWVMEPGLSPVLKSGLFWVMITESLRGLYSASALLSSIKLSMGKVFTQISTERSHPPVYVRQQGYNRYAHWEYCNKSCGLPLPSPGHARGLLSYAIGVPNTWCCQDTKFAANTGSFPLMIVCRPVWLKTWYHPFFPRATAPAYLFAGQFSQILWRKIKMYPPAKATH